MNFAFGLKVKCFFCYIQKCNLSSKKPADHDGNDDDDDHKDMGGGRMKAKLNSCITSANSRQQKQHNTTLDLSTELIFPVANLPYQLS